MLLKVATKSLLHRRVSVVLTVIMIAVSVFVLLSVDTLRYQVKHSFTNTVSGIDLIVGARTSPLNVLLYSVFHIGNPTHNVTWQSYQDVKSNPNVAWTIPLSLGDSHKGYRVIGTGSDLFTRFTYSKDKAIEFAQGRPFDAVYSAVIGADVAHQLGYSLGDKIILAHGIAEHTFSKHNDTPFQITGILKPTGTPFDNTVLVSVHAIEAIHQNWRHGVKISDTHTNIAVEQLQPKAITAFMIGLKSKLATFELQRQINSYSEEPLTAVLPGATLVALWQIVGNIENVLMLVSFLVLFGALLGMSNMLLVSMRERQSELTILRIMGASPWVIMLLIELEAILIVISGMVLALGSLWLSLALMSDYLMNQYGLVISIQSLNMATLLNLVWVLLASIVITLIPAISAYRRSLFMG
jgi:putative ABC transport system permease protein